MLLLFAATVQAMASGVGARELVVALRTPLSQSFRRSGMARPAEIVAFVSAVRGSTVSGWIAR
jgi:hypothetical protein